MRFGNSYPEGGIDMSRRYVIEGDVLDGYRVYNDGAHIVDVGAFAHAESPDGEGGDANADAEVMVDDRDAGAALEDDLVPDVEAAPDADDPTE